MVKKSQIFVKRPHYIYLEGHIFHCFSTTSSIKEFVVTVQIFVYNCVLGKKKNNTHETFHILKMKALFKKKYFGIESSFLNPFLTVQAVCTLKKGRLRGDFGAIALQSG